MTDRRIVLAFGTRPEATKMAPVYRAIEHQTGLTPLILSTGQQRQMLDGALNVFGLTALAYMWAQMAKAAQAQIEATPSSCAMRLYAPRILKENTG